MSKVWMITGAGRGLGRAFVAEAVKNGDKVIATVRKLNRNDDLMKNENVLPVIMDVTKPDEIRNAVKAGVDKFSRIDILINNAGFGMTGAFEEASDEELRFLMETNYFGVANVIREVLPVMREQKEGMILNISSQAGAMAFLGSTAYCSAKFDFEYHMEQGNYIQSKSFSSGFQDDERDHGYRHTDNTDIFHQFHTDLRYEQCAERAFHSGACGLCDL